MTAVPPALPGDPLGLASQHPGTQVEDALVGAQVPVAYVKWLVVYEQADDLAVGDVDQRLADIRVAVARLGVEQRMRLVEAVEVRAWQAVRLALLEICPQPDVPVRERRSTRSGPARRDPARSREPPTVRLGRSGAGSSVLQ